MIFYIALGVLALIVIAVLIVMGFILFDTKADFVIRFFACVCTIVVGALISTIPGAGSVAVWSNHASDLSKVFAQDKVIQVQAERIESLTTRLDKFNYPRSALLNADTPVAAIVTAINEAEAKLAYAKTEKAKAIRSIEERRYGPFSGVIWFVGDYK